MKIAKHSAEAQRIKQLEKKNKELTEIIDRKDQEIKDIKTECAEQFQKIRDLCFINEYGNKNLKLRKIHEIASDNFLILVKDIFIDTKYEENENEKIIKLPTTDQSNR